MAEKSYRRFTTASKYFRMGRRSHGTTSHPYTTKKDVLINMKTGSPRIVRFDGANAAAKKGDLPALIQALADGCDPSGILWDAVAAGRLETVDYIAERFGHSLEEIGHVAHLCSCSSNPCTGAFKTLKYVYQRGGVVPRQNTHLLSCKPVSWLRFLSEHGYKLEHMEMFRENAYMRKDVALFLAFDAIRRRKLNNVLRDRTRWREKIRAVHKEMAFIPPGRWPSVEGGDEYKKGLARFAQLTVKLNG